MLLLFLSLSSLARELGPPDDTEYYLYSLSNYKVAIPVQHTIDRAPPTFMAPADSDEGTSEIIVHFSAAWMASHIKGFQPILNEAFQPAIVLLYVGIDRENVLSNQRKIGRPIWEATGRYSQRVITGRREPNTGLHILKAIPGDYQWMLVETLPDPSKPYPADPPWIPMFCLHTAPSIVPGAQAFTRCTAKVFIRPDIMFETKIASENLRIRDRITSAITDEVLRWIEIGEQANANH